jgi:hypothetical protein
MKVERHKIVDIRLKGLQLGAIFNSGLDRRNRRYEIGLS